MRKILFLVSLSFVPFIFYAQESEEEWEPQTHITGYMTTTAEYTDHEYFVDAKKDIAVGLADVAFLASYKPLEKLELKTTLVYTHKQVEFQSMLVEAYGTYSFSDMFKIGAGKFLTPLSPGNVYFFQPINPSGVLPMLISHHYITPQSISGLQVSGKTNGDLGVEYNITYGNYTTLGHQKQGVSGLIGYEDFGIIPGIAFDPVDKQNYDLGGSARLAVDFKRMVTLGLNMFEGTRATIAIGEFDPAVGLIYRNVPSQKRFFGVDMHLKLLEDKLKLNGEYWLGSNKSISIVDQGGNEELGVEYDGFYAEAIYVLGKLTPYVRYEKLSDAKGIVYAPYPTNLVNEANSVVTSIGGGLAYRPLYEVLLKFDYRAIAVDGDEGFEAVGAKDLEFNHIMISTVFSF